MLTNTLTKRKFLCNRVILYLFFQEARRVIFHSSYTFYIATSHAQVFQFLLILASIFSVITIKSMMSHYGFDIYFFGPLRLNIISCGCVCVCVCAYHIYACMYICVISYLDKCLILFSCPFWADLLISLLLRPGYYLHILGFNLLSYALWTFWGMPFYFVNIDLWVTYRSKIWA